MRDRLRQFPTYVVAVARHWNAIAGGVVLSLVPAILDRLTNLEPPRWAYTLGLGGGLLVSQYLAWRDAWENRGTPTEPHVGRGLVLGRQALRRLPRPGNPPELREGLEITFGALVGLEYRSIEICFSVPVYAHNALLAEHGGRFIRGAIAPKTPYSLVVDPARAKEHEPPIAWDGGLVLTIETAGPGSVLRLEWARSSDRPSLLHLLRERRRISRST